MRRIILLIILVILYCFIINEKAKDTFLEKIDLSLDENEIGVVIYNDELLFKIDDETTLILLNDAKGTTKFLNTFGINRINNLITYNDIIPNLNYDNKYSVNNLYLKNMKMDKDNLKIMLHDYVFCIYEGGDTSNCTFIYLKNEVDDIKINNQNKAIFFKEKKEIEEKLYTKWIDSYALNDESYTIIKVGLDNFNIINVPIKF